MGKKKNMRNPIKREFLERQKKSTRTMQDMINDGKIGEFDHLEERTDEFWNKHQAELEARNLKQKKD